MTETPAADAGDQADHQSDEALEANADAGPARSLPTGDPRVRIGAVVAVAIVVGIVIWLIVGRGSNSNAAASTPTTTQPVSGPVVKSIGPVAFNPASLRSEAVKIGQPIYWAGAQAGHTYEFTRTTGDNLYTRYLPVGVKAGAPGSSYLIVATYPDANAYRGLLAVAHGQQVNVPGGGIALVDASYPKSVHLAYPGVPYQVEVYSPTPATALRVATSGKVAPVG